MTDLTQGSITRHLLKMASFTAATMIFQTLYYLVDLYFVSNIGKEAVAGVGVGGNVMLAIMALTQMLGAGTSSLIAQAAGRKDQPDAQLVFNQSCVLSVIAFAIVFVSGLFLSDVYARWLSPDQATFAQASDYLKWFVPALSLQFALISMGSALRATGAVKPGMVVQVITVLVNLALAPVLIAGWGTGRPMGVAGAGIATLVAILVGVVLLTIYFLKIETFVRFDPAHWSPRLDVWKKLLNIGLPAGGEFMVFSAYGALVYWIIRDFGAAAQAGFGIAGRIMQSAFLPVIAISFAASPIAGQNFGARRPDRVREAFRSAAILGSTIMLIVTLLCHVSPEALMRIFTKDTQVVSPGAEYLKIVSWNFVFSGLIFTTSGMFQALGNTWPSLGSSLMRLVLFAAPAVWLATSHGKQFSLADIWWLSVATICLQAIANVVLLRREMDRKLPISAS